MPNERLDRRGGHNRAYLVGMTFGKLTVVRYHGSNKRQSAVWLCRCECKNMHKAITSELRNGSVRSCGCGQRAGNRLTHGHARVGKVSPTYSSWHSMIQRCMNPNKAEYYWYGAKGVKVCKRWKKFENFLHDMGERPAGMTLGRRLDSNNYTRGNAFWQSWASQGHHKHLKAQLSKAA